MLPVMRVGRRLVPLVVLLGALAATTAVARADTVSWGSAIEVPGTAALNAGGNAYVTSVSCPSAGECAAGGWYTDGSQGVHAFVVSEQGGVWGSAIEVPGMAALGPSSGEAIVWSVSCSSPGNCAAGGYYSGAFGTQAFVVDETNGVWGTAIEVPGTAALNVAGIGAVWSVSCGSTGDCAAGGYYSDHFNPDGDPADPQAFVVSEHGGVWGTARAVPGTALSGAFYSNATSVSCAGPGDCVVGGSYVDRAHKHHGFVVVERNNTWHNAFNVRMGVNSVSCASPGNCVAGGGRYILAERNTRWGTVIDVVGVANLYGGSHDPRVLSVSCASAGNCAVGGSYRDGAHHYQAFVVGEKKGKWAKPIKVPGTAVLNVGGDALVGSVSCASPGNCAATGYYTDGSGPGGHQPFVVSEQGGVWGHARQVPGTATLGGHAFGGVSVSCASAGRCAIGGNYVDAAGYGQAFVTAP
jgi:hypothetical protein